MPSRNSHVLPDGSLDGAASSSKRANGYAAIPIRSSSSPPSFLPSGVRFIEHRVSKMDTLAGVAINYGVEVADIKRVNGLVADIQMFAHRSLQIPLPGKHPPSPVLPNGSTQKGEKTPPRRPPYDILHSLQSLKPNPPPRPISPAMCTLQCFYGLAGNTEIAETLNHRENQKPSESPIADPILRRHRKSRSLANIASLESGDIDADRSIRRRQKADPSHGEEEGAFSGRTGKALRRSSLAEAFASVRKSPSASSLGEADGGGSSAIGAARKWSSKPDAVSRPIFDGLPKPIIALRNKAALD